MSRRKGTGQPVGRRTQLLDAEVRTTLVQQTRMGAPVDMVAAAAGIPPRTFYDWMARGREEDDRLTTPVEDGEDPPVPLAREAPYLELMREVQQARAQAGVKNVANIQRAAQGGFVTEETTRKYRDENGEMVEETTIRRAAPDWKASAWYLERQQRNHFGRDVERVEVTGADGGPIQMSVDPDKLSEKIAANIADLTAAIRAGEEQRAIEAAYNGEDVHDGEIVTG